MRKIIEISSCRVENDHRTQCNYVLFALCDDGSVWEIVDTRPDWSRLPDIPQAAE